MESIFFLWSKWSSDSGGIGFCAQGHYIVTCGLASQAIQLKGGLSAHCTALPGQTPAIEKGFKNALSVCVYVHAYMWVACACVQKSNCSNVLPSLFFFMCVPRVAATFLQIFIPGVKCSWSLSSVYSPVLSHSWLLHWPFFILTKSDSREGTESRGGGEEQVSMEWGQEERERESKKKVCLEERDVSRGAGRESVQRDGWLVIILKSKAQLTKPFLAKAHNAIVQGGPLA